MAKIHIEKETLKKVLKIGGLCIVPNRTVPMSDYIRITTKGKRIKVEATNALTSIKTYTDIDLETEEMSFCVNFKDLMNYVSAISDDVITLDVNLGNKCITIFHTEGELTLACLDASDFPDFENAGKETFGNINIKSEVLSKWLASAKDFVATDDIRPALCGAYLCGKEGRLSISASDSKILIYDECVKEDIKEPFGLIINSAAFSAISSLISESETVNVKYSDSKVWFSVGSTSMSVILTSGKYPNVKSVIPSAFEHEATISKKSISDSLKRIGLIVSNTLLLKFKFTEDGVLNVEHENLTAAKKASEKITYGGYINFSIGFGYKALTKAINAMEGESIHMRLTDPKKAVVFTEESEESNKVVLVMPVMI